MIYVIIYRWDVLAYDEFARHLDSVLQEMTPVDSHGLLCISGHHREAARSSFQSDLSGHLGPNTCLTLTNEGDYLVLIQDTTVGAALRLTRLARYAFERATNAGCDRTASFGLVLFKMTNKRPMELVAIAEVAARAADTAALNRIELIELTD